MPLSAADRISVVFEEQFRRYCDLFITYYKRTPHHTRCGYDRPFYQKNYRKGGRIGQPIPLVDSPDGSWTVLTDTVEKHLDYHQWLDYTTYTGGKPAFREGDHFWLGLHAGKSTSYTTIDLDNHRQIALYRGGFNNTGRPRVCQYITLDYFRQIKKVHDHFPGRIWCVSSDSLGLDVIERHGLRTVEASHDRTTRRLEAIGLHGVEAHPMRGRCKRRPFGEHYRTITAAGLLETWQDQLDHFDNPTTPDLIAVVESILTLLSDQWRAYESFARAKIPDIHRGEVARIRRWVDDGFPDEDRVIVGLQSSSLASLAADAVAATGGNGHDSPLSGLSGASAGGNTIPSYLSSYKMTNKEPRPRATAASLLLHDFRMGDWPLKVEEVARDGLPGPDCLQTAAHELAKWLYWVELYDTPRGERAEAVLDLLKTFAATKGNGYISRLEEGKADLVEGNLKRIVESVARIDNPEALAWFLKTRQRRDSGKYSRLIYVAPLICSGASRSLPFRPMTRSKATCKEPRSDRLPDQIESTLDAVVKRFGMRKRGGDYPFVTFARRLVNLLFDNEGRADIDLETFLGWTNNSRSQNDRFKKLLAQANIIHGDWERTIKRGVKSATYKLTAQTMKAMGLDYAAEEAGWKNVVGLTVSPAEYRKLKEMGLD
ncbi:hypothetical protein [Tautonia plasticadhaerens]|uniref:hypothetical protein n=1 Tax=Tautonia plasticadhaerens TaxID=2527974 RepID=UPI0011A346D0|nr:hypothetical protein [Tautonia plasticadhaerens]